jgi:hypothetical protein
MTISRIRNVREWFHETFVRGGYFSLRPLPTTNAERAEAAKSIQPEKNITRLNLDSDARSK